MTLETMGERLRRIRLAAGLTQNELGVVAGISGSAISQIESGDSTGFKPENLFAIARKLNKNPEWLATGRGHERDTDALVHAIMDLPPDSADQVLDFIAYRWQRTAGRVAHDKQAKYIAVAEGFKHETPRLPDNSNQ